VLIYIRKDGRVTLPKKIREGLMLAPQSWARALIQPDSITLMPLQEEHQRFRIEKLKA
jgi:bifunctional DNA-binding transcriptional regulator/antitoxin component of YhaV-PrlF toxin-antitoxin module